MLPLTASPSPLDILHPVDSDAEAEQIIAANPGSALYRSKIIPQSYVVIPPPSVIQHEEVAVSANKRHLYCDKCQEVKTHTLKQVNNWNGYVCECGESLTYFVNHAPATRAMG